MADNFSKDPKKRRPGGFLLFILAAIVIILTLQTLGSDKNAKISFSHQLEHLINLDLIKPEDNKKIAQNDNLVTFSSRFKTNQSEDAKNRFQYLNLLNEKHLLNLESKSLANELNFLEKGVIQSANWFLYLSAKAIPQTGFSVISSKYDMPIRENAITIKEVTDKNVLNIKQLNQKFKIVKQNPTNENTANLKEELLSLITLIRSPNLGIGDENLKKILKDTQNSIDSITDKTPLNSQISIFTSTFKNLDIIENSLLKEKNGVRLLGLRTVRNYVESLERFNMVQKELFENENLLFRAREKVVNNFWFFNNKEISTNTLEKQDPEEFTHWFNQAKIEWQNFENNKGLSLKAVDQPRNIVLDKFFKSEEPSPNYLNYIFTLLPVAIVIMLLYYLFSKQMKGGAGSSAMNFGKSPAKLLTKESNKITFKDVAGAEESKEELEEVVDFLKDPSKFTALGARIPKGVLLVGPPGTGKTLIAKAVAGEADRPFFTISGSDFVEMFVGVGASRVRDLFDKAKKNAPCIIFMDEIDAVGRHRGAGIGGGHDEREQTLNQLLVEMDGFDTREGVILMAATNRPDILDKALLRPGRFDRRVILDLPDIKGRYEILKVHAKKIKIDPSVDLMDIAKVTPGSSGADLENILNEAALLAARKGRKAVTSVEAKEACDKVKYGKERKSLEMDDQEKKTTAYHESGHTIVALKVKHSDLVDKVTIIPRGFALGATHFMPKKNRLSYWKNEIIDQLAILMGGRAAEEIFVHDSSSGAKQDITQATRLARAMVCEWGMSDKLGTVTYDEENGQNQYLGLKGSQERSYSNETALEIDNEVKKLLKEAHLKAKEIVEENRKEVELLTDMLMEFETLDKDDIKEILNGTWDSDKKRKKLQDQEDLQRKLPPSAPIENKDNNDKPPKPLEA
jgi:cell division protease FtsH